jgi:hypothetical protein
MKMLSKSKTATATALFLISIFAVSIVALPSVSAHDPPWTIKSFAYIVPAPNPVGVGQQVAIVMWIDTPLVGAAVSNTIRRHDYTLTITDPNGKVETQHWDEIQDTTSVQSYLYTPSVVARTLSSLNMHSRYMSGMLLECNLLQTIRATFSRLPARQQP